MRSTPSILLRCCSPWSSGFGMNVRPRSPVESIVGRHSPLSTRSWCSDLTTSSSISFMKCVGVSSSSSPSSSLTVSGITVSGCFGGAMFAASLSALTLAYPFPLVAVRATARWITFRSLVRILYVIECPVVSAIPTNLPSSSVLSDGNLLSYFW